MKLSSKTAAILLNRGGTCQTERLPFPLVDSDLLIDAKRLDENIVFAYLYSDLIQYYDSQNQALKHNAWRSFLENDDTVILSLILHTNISQLKSNISNNFLIPKKRKISNIEKLVLTTFKGNFSQPSLELNILINKQL